MPWAKLSSRQSKDCGGGGQIQASLVRPSLLTSPREELTAAMAGGSGDERDVALDPEWK